MSWHLKILQRKKINITFAPRTCVRHDLGQELNKFGEKELSQRMFLE